MAPLLDAMASTETEEPQPQQGGETLEQRMARIAKERKIGAASTTTAADPLEARMQRIAQTRGIGATQSAPTPVETPKPIAPVQPAQPFKAEEPPEMPKRVLAAAPKPKPQPTFDNAMTRPSVVRSIATPSNPEPHPVPIADNGRIAEPTLTPSPEAQQSEQKFEQRFGEKPAQVNTNDDTGASVVVGQPKGVGVPKSELDRLIGNPDLKTRIASRIAALSSEKGYTYHAPAPTFADLATDTFLTDVASPFLGGVSEQEKELKMQEYAAGGGQFEKWKANLLGLLAAGGSVTGNVALSKALGANAGAGNGTSAVVANNPALEGLGLRAGARAAGASETEVAQLAQNKLLSTPMPHSMQAGAVAAVRDMAREYEVHPSATAKIIAKARAVLSNQAPIAADALRAGGVQAAQGAAFGAGTAALQGQDAEGIAKEAGKNALLMGTLGAFLHGLSAQQQYQAGYKAARNALELAARQEAASTPKGGNGNEPTATASVTPEPKPSGGANGKRLAIGARSEMGERAAPEAELPPALPIPERGNVLGVGQFRGQKGTVEPIDAARSRVTFESGESIEVHNNTLPQYVQGAEATGKSKKAVAVEKKAAETKAAPPGETGAPTSRVGRGIESSPRTAEQQQFEEKATETLPEALPNGGANGRTPRTAEPTLKNPPAPDLATMEVVKINQRHNLDDFVKQERALQESARPKDEAAEPPTVANERAMRTIVDEYRGLLHSGKSEDEAKQAIANRQLQQRMESVKGQQPAESERAEPVETTRKRIKDYSDSYTHYVTQATGAEGRPPVPEPGRDYHSDLHRLVREHGEAMASHPQRQDLRRAQGMIYYPDAAKAIHRALKPLGVAADDAKYYANSAGPFHESMAPKVLEPKLPHLSIHKFADEINVDRVIERVREMHAEGKSLPKAPAKETAKPKEKSPAEKEKRLRTALKREPPRRELTEEEREPISAHEHNLRVKLSQAINRTFETLGTGEQDAAHADVDRLRRELDELRGEETSESTYPRHNDASLKSIRASLVTHPNKTGVLDQIAEIDAVLERRKSEPMFKGAVTNEDKSAALDAALDKAKVKYEKLGDRTVMKLPDGSEWSYGGKLTPEGARTRYREYAEKHLDWYTPTKRGPTPTPGKKTDYAGVSTDDLFKLIDEEQSILEKSDAQHASGQWVRIDDHGNAISGGSMSGGRGKVQGKFARTRLDSIEEELRKRGVSDEKIQAHRYHGAKSGTAGELTHEPDVADLSTQDFDFRAAPFETPKVLAAREYNERTPSTHSIDTPARRQLRAEIADKEYGDGAKTKGKEFTFLMGLPGSGKSTIAREVAEKSGALLTDADRIKEQLPEYADGRGSLAVHRESVAIRDAVRDRAIANGDNIVVQTLGLYPDDLKKQIDALAAAGWKVHLKLADLPAEVAAERSNKRFEAGGHFIDPAYILSNGDVPKRTFDTLKAHPGVTSYERYDTDVPRGEAARLVEHGEASGRGHAVDQGGASRGAAVDRESREGAQTERAAEAPSGPVNGNPRSLRTGVRGQPAGESARDVSGAEGRERAGVERAGSGGAREEPVRESTGGAAEAASGPGERELPGARPASQRLGGTGAGDRAGGSDRAGERGLGERVVERSVHHERPGTSEPVAKQPLRVGKPKPTQEDPQLLAIEREGRLAFEQGKGRVVPSGLISRGPAAMKAWYRGWDQANLAPESSVEVTRDRISDLTRERFGREPEEISREGGQWSVTVVGVDGDYDSHTTFIVHHPETGKPSFEMIDASGAAPATKKVVPLFPTVDDVDERTEEERYAEEKARGRGLTDEEELDEAVERGEITRAEADRRTYFREYSEWRRTFRPAVKGDDISTFDEWLVDEIGYAAAKKLLGRDPEDRALHPPALDPRSPERVGDATITLEDGTVVSGPTHMHAYQEAVRRGLLDGDTLPPTGSEGFRTSRGRIVSREEAMEIAEQSGQISDEESVQLREDEGPGLAAEHLGRQSPELIPEVAAKTPAQIKKVVDHEPGVENFVIPPEGLNLERGAVARAEDNVAAIKLLKHLEAAKRTPTREEQETLAKYVGWGGIAGYLDKGHKLFDSPLGTEIRDLLTPEEFAAAAASTPNAHYTSVDVARAMHDALKRLGFEGGHILEPSMGSGVFLGTTPTDEASDYHWTGVELDAITGRIASYLYPKSDVRVQGFQKLKVPDEHFDAAIGNVPFGEYGVADKRYDRLKLSIHNYFFARSLDLVRPGGVIAYVTSRYTMDEKDGSFRKYIAERAEFLGAIRLPETAFKASAGTSVTTDIILLKRVEPNSVRAQPDPFIRLEPIDTADGPIAINEYFAAHPEMMLGTPSLTGTMYASKTFTLEPHPGVDLKDALARAIERLPKGVYTPKVVESPATRARAQLPGAIEQRAPDEMQEGTFTIVDGRLKQNNGGALTEPKVPATRVEAVRALTEIKLAVKELLNAEVANEPDAVIASKRKEANRLYDSFVKARGPINTEQRVETKRTDKEGNPVVQFKYPNLAGFTDDPEFPWVTMLEDYDSESGTAKKADILSRRVMEPRRAPERVDTPSLAIPVVLAESGKIVIDRVAQLSGTTPERVIEALNGSVIFQNPRTEQWEPADQYLSGDVKSKLAEAKDAAQKDVRFKPNVDALTKAIPEDIPPSGIGANLGAPWIPKEDILRFVRELLNVAPNDERYLKLHYIAYDSTWKLEAASYLHGAFEAANEFGTPAASAYELIDDALNQRQTEVSKTVFENGEEKRVRDVDATLAAQEKQQAIKDRFRSWLWQDAERAVRLARLYNDKFNRIRLPNPDGSHLTLPGAASHVKGMPFKLRPHQLNAIWRILAYGNTLLAHVVGSGKTYTMVAAGMEAKRLGLARKPLYVVPNHMLAQFRDEFKGLYPMAKLLVATKDDFAGDSRREFVGRAAAHDWDAIIMTHRSFESVPMSADFQREFVEREMDELAEAIREANAGGGDRSLVKMIEKAKKRLEAKLERLLAADKKDQFLSFEQMGADMIFVDEAHYGKNLAFATKMRGISVPSSERAFDLFLKTQYLERINPGRGIVFATGTPISNALAEMFTLQRYLQFKLLQERGLSAFDAWGATFAEPVTKLEISPQGAGARVKTRLAKFNNMGELAQMFRLVTDVQSAEDLKLPRPELAGGKMQVVAAPPTAALKNFVNDLVARAKLISEKKPRRFLSADGKEFEDNFLLVTTHGRNAAMDMRLVDAEAHDDPNGKLNIAAKNIADIYHETTPLKGTQLVFSDLSAPGSDPSRSLGGVPHWNAYDAVKGKLVALGVPAKDIRFMHEADSDEKKRKLFADVRAGRVRILLGSTEKMGAGTNVQDRLVALHHLDAPWRPSDVEQRNGRILRQGNLLYNTGKIPHVRVFAYVTEGSFDAYIWQGMERKADFIQQALKAGPGMRTVEDEGSIEVDFATAKAIASGNPKVMEKAQVDNDIARFERLERAHQDQMFHVKREMTEIPAQIKELEPKVAAIEADLAKVTDTSGDKFKVVINGSTLTKRADAGEALSAAVTKASMEAAKKTGDEVTKRLGTFAGLELFVVATTRMLTGSADTYLALRGEDAHFRELEGNESPTSLVSILEHIPDHMESDKERLSGSLERKKTKLAALTEAGVKPFEHAAKLKDLRARQETLGKELEADAKRAEEEATRSPAARGDSIRKAVMGDDLDKGGPSPGSATELYAFADPFTAAIKMWRQANALRNARLAQSAGIRYVEPPKPKVLQAVAMMSRENRDAIYALFTPGSIDEDAGVAGRIKNAKLGEKALSDERARNALLEAHAFMSKLKEPERYAFVDRFEHGLPQPTPYMQKLDDTIRAVMDERSAALKALGKGHLRTFRKNYWGRLLVNPKKTGTRTPQQQAFLDTMTRRPLAGAASFKKKRTFEYLADALAAGYKPITNNPVDWLLLKIREMNRYIAAHEIKNELRDVGLVKFVRPKRLPDGWSKLDDRIFTVYARKGTQGEQRIRGWYIAPTPVARIINNYLSPGLRGNPIYDGYMFLGNTMNMIQLGFSFFHLGFVAFDATISQAALALEQLATPGQRAMGARNLAISSASMALAPLTGIPLPSPALMLAKGRVLNAAYRFGTTDLKLERMVEAVTQGGGRVKMDDLYKSDAVTKMRAAFRDRRFLKTAFEAPFAATEMSVKPVLEYIVPRLKLGAFYSLAEHELAKLPTGATEDDIRRVLQAAWSTIDDRLGQVVYDNYHWHNVLKHSLMGGVRAVGWNRGSLSLTFGGAASALGAPVRAFRLASGGSGGGKGGGPMRLGAGSGAPKPGDEGIFSGEVMNHRLAYFIAAAALMALYGALYTALHTGDRPGYHDGKYQGGAFLAKDLYFPRTGTVNRDHSLERVSPATYIKDVVSFWKHPIDTMLHKVQPALNLLVEVIFTNENYFGDQIRNTEDPKFLSRDIVHTQAYQVAEEVIKSYQPMSVSNYLEARKRGAGLSELSQNFVGIAPASRELVRTPAQNLMNKYLGQHSAGLSPEERDAANVRSELRRGIEDKTKTRSDVRKLVIAGELTPRQGLNIGSAGRRDPRLLQFERLTPEQALKVFAVANDEEKALWQRIYDARKRQVTRVQERRLKFGGAK